MRAALLEKYGGENAVEVKSIDQPKPAANQVQVEVYAASVNPFDYKIRGGLMKDSVPINFPLVIGGDLAGVVSALGEDVRGVNIGDQVYGLANATKQGSVAEYSVVNVSQLALKPNLDFETSAALPLVAASAYQALNEELQLAKGQKILIHGGGGGIGSIAIQLAKNIGAYVATTVSEKDKSYASDLGADLVIDYKEEDFTKLVKDYDFVYDTVGGETAEKSYQVLRPGGKLVSMAAQPNQDLETKYQVKASHIFTKASTKVLNEITKLVNNNDININIDKVFSLDEAAAALEYLKTGHPRGKVVIKVKN